jgi:hypothetical protein
MPVERRAEAATDRAVGRGEQRRHIRVAHAGVERFGTWHGFAERPSKAELSEHLCDQVVSFAGAQFEVPVSYET